ncbi:hypothetical protein M9H77_13026 [Catharanthus roseus]|uniref:Uncharacterized protein n=1 Tax=Catharanthus roseus TaxID=4058 RepID=A0ACC0BJ59_CATRO|nr:hypothetical protein M9H77_13026 [Catharanthus roseus]
MRYTWANSSWQRMEVIGRQEMAYSKLTSARSNCYKAGGYSGNAYRGSPKRDRHSTHRSQMGIGNFSSRAKAFDHIPYEDCCENSPYYVHKGYHSSHDYRDQNCVEIVLRWGMLTIAPSVSLGNNSYGFDGSLLSLLGDDCVKFQEDVVEHFQYMLTFLDTYVKNIVEQILVDKTFIGREGIT